MRTGKKRGLRPRPEGGWTLDGVLVGVGTLRTMRELFRQEQNRFASPPRAWDLALWSGVSPQGAADALKRLERAGIVTALSPTRRGYAPAFRLELGHPLTAPLRELFRVESLLARRAETQAGSARHITRRQPLAVSPEASATAQA